MNIILTLLIIVAALCLIFGIFGVYVVIRTSYYSDKIDSLKGKVYLAFKSNDICKVRTLSKQIEVCIEKRLKYVNLFNTIMSESIKRPDLQISDEDNKYIPSSNIQLGKMYCCLNNKFEKSVGILSEIIPCYSYGNIYVFENKNYPEEKFLSFKCI